MLVAVGASILVGPHVRVAVLALRSANFTRFLCVFLAHSARLRRIKRLLRLIGGLAGSVTNTNIRRTRGTYVRNTTGSVRNTNILTTGTFVRNRELFFSASSTGGIDSSVYTAQNQQRERERERERET